MRLAVFTNQFPGPVSTFFARDMRGLIDAGIDIDVFAIYPYNPALWQYVPNVLNDTILPRHKVHHLTIAECVRSPLKDLPSKKLVQFLRDVFSISASTIRYGAESFAKSGYVFPKSWVWANQYGEQFDHVLGYWGNYAGTCAYLFHRLSKGNSPFSIFLHASIDLYHEPVYMREKLLYADNIITCSDFNRQFISEQYSDTKDSILEKVHVHYHGLDFHQLAQQFGERSPRKVIAVGRFAKQKGFDYLLRAFRELKDRNVDVQLELVGDGEENQSLNRLASELDVRDIVTFRGWLPADEVPRAIGQATILVHPSPDLGDGVPNVIKEAMALGTPVIGSRVAGIPELLDGGKCGFLVPPKDVNQLADAIQAMLANEPLRQKYADAARKQAQHKFDLWKNGRKLATVLSSGRLGVESHQTP
jgi:colanic acid/amylovoran biosynthesis glycosyltransferase